MMNPIVNPTRSPHIAAMGIDVAAWPRDTCSDGQYQLVVK
jgi:hypothetical protein